MYHDYNGRETEDLEMDNMRNDNRESTISAQNCAHAHYLFNGHLMLLSSCEKLTPMLILVL